MTPLIEICVEGPDGAVAAERGGGNRVELCASLLEGGLTPSLGVLRATLGAVRLPVMAMVRPRGGDFLYSELEYAAMLEDVAGIRAAGAAGVVFGCLTEDGDIDEARTAALVAAARPLPVTFHRAFDMARDPADALEALVRCGVHRVLTSGQRPTALQGLVMLRRLLRQAAGRITVMACGALGADNIGLVRDAGFAELHFAALREQPSRMQWRNPEIGMGATGIEREYTITISDEQLIARTIAAVR